MKPTSADVVVIGAGVRGTSIAYHLAKAGVDTIVVDRGFICSNTSGATFALINVSSKTPAAYTELSLASSKLYDGLAEELDCDIEFHSGTQVFYMIDREEDLPAAHSFIQRMQSASDLTFDMLTPDQVREFEPSVSPQIAGGILCHQDGRVNPFRLTFGYAAAARRLGARFLTQHEVVGIQVEHERVQAVLTQHGAISCRWVVNAAGIDTATIGAMVGTDVPVAAFRAQALTTEPLPGLLRQPVGTLTEHLEIVPTDAGPILLLIASDNEFVGQDRTVEWEAMTGALVRRAASIIPALANARIIRAWAGLRPWPIDGLPIMGPVPGIDGFLIATGHSGYTLAQITGQIIRDLIVTGHTTLPLYPFSLDRFHEGRFAFSMRAWQNAKSSTQTVPLLV